MRTPGPLWRAAPLRALREGVRALLVLVSITLLGAAAASGPMFEDASRNAAMRSALESVPPGARASDSAVVRIVRGSSLDSSRSDPTQSPTVQRLARIPGLAPARVSGVSIGLETYGRDSRYGFAASAGGRSVGVRLAAAPDPDRVMVPTSSVADRGIWLSAQTAKDLGVAAGGQVQLTLTRIHRKPAVVTTRVHGIFATVAGAALPADVAGGSYWSLLRGSLPVEPQATSIQSQLVVADVATIDRIATGTSDPMLWFVDTALAPGNDTLDGVGRTAAGVEALRSQLLDPDTVLTGPETLRPEVASGIAILHRAAREVAEATVTRSSSMTGGAVLLALGSVAAVVVLGLNRRRVELRLTTSLGLRPLTVGALAVLEHLLLAVAGCALGVAAAYAVVRAVGPPGEMSEESVRSGARLAVGAGLLALALVWALTTTACLLLARPTTGALRRRVPWEPLIVVAAGVAAAGLLTGPDEAGGQQGLALLVPLLVTAAVGAVGGRLVLGGLRLLLSRRQVGSTAEGGPLTPRQRTRARRRWVRRLALRRLAAPAGSRAAVVGIMATGLALLLFALTAATSTRDTTTDRVAVIAGAAATADVASSSVLDPNPPRLGDDGQATDPDAPIRTVAHDPPVAAGQTVTWRTRVSIGGQFGNVELLAVTPSTFDGAASWGSGHALVAARTALSSLRVAGERAAAELVDSASVDVPVIAVNAPALPTGARAPMESWGPEVRVKVIASVAAFPGLGTMPMLVAPSDALFNQFGAFDPRWEDKKHTAAESYLTASLWSSGGPADLQATLDARGAKALKTTTELAAGQQPELVAAERSLGYLRAMGLCMGLLAALAFALHADRSATRGRAGDLLLAAAGMRRHGVRSARLLELALMAVPALALAVLGALALVPMAPRLLDPQRGQQIPFVLRLDGDSLAQTAVLAVGSLLVAGLVVLARQRSSTPEEVLRGDE